VEEEALNLFEMLISLKLTKNVVIAFGKDVARGRTGDPMRRFQEAIEILKNNKKYKNILEKLETVTFDPGNASEELKKYVDQDNTEVFVFAKTEKNAEGAPQRLESLRDVESEEEVHTAYIVEGDFPMSAEYPLAPIVAITIAQSIDPSIIGDGLIKALQAIEGDITLEDLNIESITREGRVLIFTLLPEAEPRDAQVLIKKYAALKQFFRSV
jgi:hypothetical protein